ncbi:MAG: ATP-binding cassette domain-containing protein [Clostridia bacterium]|nr:ATP-binding cassette domain-containing protein [Clostridia bacterium]
MEKLLSINNLKKYFPLAKTKLFQKEQLYTRANEDISIDIFQGETFGLVGESGCGKSTLGRVLLQIYEQTAGNCMYYGRTIDSVAPQYVKNTLSHATAFVEKYHMAKQKAQDLTAKCDSLGDEATFFDLQEKNLAVADAKTALDNVAKILGGFVAKDTKAGAALLLERYGYSVRLAKLNEKISDAKLEIEILEAKEGGKDNSGKVSKINAKINVLQGACDKYEASIADVDKKITDLKAKYADDAEFSEYEEMLDNGIDLSRLNKAEMRLLRKDLQIIFQDPYSSLNPRMTVGQIIEEGLITHKFYKPGSPKMKEHVFRVMEECGLQKYMYNRYPHQFSGGQRQRICIARALAVNPKFVVCDECVSALDVSIQSQIINLLQDLKEQEKLTYLFISHNLSVVRYISDRIGVMYLGNIVEIADTDTLFKDPRHPYTLALLSSIPTTDPDSLSKERIILEGNIPGNIKPPSGCKFHTRCYMACDKCKRVPPPLTEVEPGHFVACHFLEKKMDENGNYLFDVNLADHGMERN